MMHAGDSDCGPEGRSWAPCCWLAARQQDAELGAATLLTGPQIVGTAGRARRPARPSLFCEQLSEGYLSPTSLTS
jgi:hypothetical protein